MVKYSPGVKETMENLDTSVECEDISAIILNLLDFGIPASVH